MRGAEGYLTHTQRRRWGEGRTDTKMLALEIRVRCPLNQGVLAGLRSWKGQGPDSLLELLEGVWPRWNLDFDPVAPISDVWPPALWENTFLLLELTKFVLVCYRNDGNLIQHLMAWKLNWYQYRAAHFPPLLYSIGGTTKGQKRGKLLYKYP